MTNHALMSQEMLHAVLREDFTSFNRKVLHSLMGAGYVHGWHVDLIADRLTQCYHREIQRLIICLPPRFLKSTIASVAFPAWLMGKDPKAKIVTISYANDLAAKFARDQKKTMLEPWYGETFPMTRLSRKKNEECEFETTAGGYRLATSMGGTLTGRGGNFIIIDDPMKPQDALSDVKRGNTNQWIDNTLLSRLDDQYDGVIIVVMQRVHPDDTAAYLKAKGGWDVLELPAIAHTDKTFRMRDRSTLTFSAGEALHPERQSLQALKLLERQIGSNAFSTQYLQLPVPVEGNIIKKEWFKYFNMYPAERRIVQSWDIAMTNNSNSDWSVCTTWMMSNRKYYLIDVFRERLEFPALKRKVVELRNHYGANCVLMEESAISIPLIQQLRSEGTHVIKIKPQGNKTERLTTASLAMEAGQVFFPPKNPHWLEGFCAELLTFPGHHDDQADSFSQFINWAETRYRWSTRVFQR